MSAQELCPICGEGHVTPSMQMVEYEYKGHKVGGAGVALPAVRHLHLRLCGHG